MMKDKFYVFCYVSFPKMYYVKLCNVSASKELWQYLVNYITKATHYSRLNLAS